MDLSNLDADIATKILSALIDDQVPEDKPQVPVAEQIQYLKRWINSVSLEDRKSIGNILILNNKKDCLKLCNEGTVINLDSLSPAIIGQMYVLLQYKRECKLNSIKQGAIA